MHVSAELAPTFRKSKPHGCVYCTKCYGVAAAGSVQDLTALSVSLIGQDVTSKGKSMFTTVVLNVARAMYSGSASML